MDSKSILDKIMYVGSKHNFLFNELGVLRLIMSTSDDYLTEDEIVEYLTVLPQVYDAISEMDYPQLVNANISIGTYIREVFGMYHVNNPRILYNVPVNDENSPEMTSFRILKKIWFTTTIDKLCNH